MLTKLLSVRIVRWQLKLAYVVGALVVGWFVVRIPRALGASSDITQTIGAVFQLGAILLGARIFRGRGEPIEPARAWWRMTAWRKLSWTLGIIFTVLGALTILGDILSFVGVRPRPEG